MQLSYKINELGEEQKVCERLHCDIGHFKSLLKKMPFLTRPESPLEQMKQH